MSGKAISVISVSQSLRGSTHTYVCVDTDVSIKGVFGFSTLNVHYVHCAFLSRKPILQNREIDLLKCLFVLNCVNFIFVGHRFGFATAVKNCLLLARVHITFRSDCAKKCGGQVILY